MNRRGHTPMSHPLPNGGPGSHISTTVYMRDDATIRAWVSGDFIAVAVEGSGKNGVAAMRPEQWQAIIDAVQAVMPRYVGDVVAIRGDDLDQLLDAFRARIDRPSVIRVWIDQIDKAAKVKIGSGTWSPPLGEIEVEA